MYMGCHCSRKRKRIQKARTSAEREMALKKLAAHPHPMIFSEFPPSALSFCTACRDLIRGASYDCKTCGYQFHKECVEIPLVLRHPFHLIHPLSLIISGGNNNDHICHFCAKSSLRLFYTCPVCINKSSCIKCAVVNPPARVVPSRIHEHSFTALARPIPFTCDACGEKGDFDPFICNLCDLMVHHLCTKLEPTLRISRHSHPLSHTFYLRDPGLFCKICRGTMHPEFGAYRCPDCNYVAHVRCARESRLHSLGSFMEGEHDEEDQEIGGGGKHVSHPQHDLTLIEYKDGEDTKICRSCVRPIYEAMYGCGSCNFFLHQKCARLPRKIQHELHDGHPLILQPTCANRISFRGIFQCDACYELCNGFCYSCSEDSCDFTLDIRCASLPQPVVLSSHPHPLFHVFPPAMGCVSCGHDDLPALRCNDCPFTLDFLCATLPQKMMHKYEQHGLSMCHGDDNDDQSSPEAYWCEICELETDKKHSFYACDVCGFTPHIKCILPFYPFVRLGDVIEHEAHPRPLILTLNESGKASCFFKCGRKYCDDGLLFKCSEANCSFAGCIFCLYSQEQSFTL